MLTPEQLAIPSRNKKVSLQSKVTIVDQLSGCNDQLVFLIYESVIIRVHLAQPATATDVKNPGTALTIHSCSMATRGALTHGEHHHPLHQSVYRGGVEVRGNRLPAPTRQIPSPGICVGFEPSPKNPTTSPTLTSTSSRQKDQPALHCRGACLALRSTLPLLI